MPVVPHPLCRMSRAKVPLHSPTKVPVPLPHSPTKGPLPLSACPDQSTSPLGAFPDQSTSPPVPLSLSGEGERESPSAAAVFGRIARIFRCRRLAVTWPCCAHASPSARSPRLPRHHQALARSEAAARSDACRALCLVVAAEPQDPRPQVPAPARTLRIHRGLLLSTPAAGTRVGRSPSRSCGTGRLRRSADCTLRGTGLPCPARAESGVEPEAAGATAASAPTSSFVPPLPTGRGGQGVRYKEPQPARGTPGSGWERGTAEVQRATTGKAG